MAKKRSLNELRQEKNYGYKPPLTHNQKSAKIREGEIDLGYTEIDIETTKDLIISNLKNHFYDLIFQEVCEHMS